MSTTKRRLLYAALILGPIMGVVGILLQLQS